MSGRNSFGDPLPDNREAVYGLESQMKSQTYEGGAPTAVATKGNSMPKAPPSEEFWQKYSPHYEFPLSNAASVAAHVVALLAVIYLTTRFIQSEEDRPVPVRGQKIAVNPGSIEGGPGSGGGDERRQEAVDIDPAMQQRSIPTEELNKQVERTAEWIPDLKNNPAALEKIVNSPNFNKLDELNQDIKDRLKKGFNQKTGAGAEAGSGTTGDKGPGPGGKGGTGDGTKSGERSMRWTLIFKTTSGMDYLKQLNAFKAQILIPEPPAWKANRLFEEITKPNPGKPSRGEDLPEMFFTDSDKGSASKVARALGMDYDPPYFIAFFPKDVENELAAKERNYRNRKENEIYSTTFRVIERNSEYIITVTDQTPIKR